MKARLSAHAIARCREMAISTEEVLGLLDQTGETAGRSIDYPSVTRSHARIVADGRLAVPYVVEGDDRVALTVLWDQQDSREEAPFVAQRRK